MDVGHVYFYQPDREQRGPWCSVGGWVAHSFPSSFEKFVQKKRVECVVSKAHLLIILVRKFVACLTGNWKSIVFSLHFIKGLDCQGFLRHLFEDLQSNWNHHS